MFETRKKKIMNEWQEQKLYVIKGNSVLELHEAIRTFMCSAGLTDSQFPDLLKDLGITLPVQFGQIVFDPYRLQFVEENGNLAEVKLIPAVRTDCAEIRLYRELQRETYVLISKNNSPYVEKV